MPILLIPRAACVLELESISFLEDGSGMVAARSLSTLFWAMQSISSMVRVSTLLVVL